MSFPSGSPAVPVAAGNGGIADNLRMARRMLWRAVLAQNIMTGFVFGAFGTFILGIEQAFEVDRATSSLPIPGVLLAIAVMNPIIGGNLHRWSFRNIMVAGALLLAAGFAWVSVATSMTQLMLAFLLLIGPASAMLGAMVPNALVTNWYDQGRGRALGWVNASLLVGVMPLASTWLQQSMSYRGVALMMAVATLLAVPLLWGVVGRPAERGLTPVGGQASAADAQAMLQVSPYATLLRSPALWAIIAVAVVLSVASTSIITHIVPMATSWGLTMDQAAWLLSALGFVGLIGSPLFGWMSDRVGPVAALCLNAGLQALCWWAMLLHHGFAAVLVSCLMLGLATNGMMGVFGVALSRRFGPANFGRCFSVFSVVNLPFTVAGPFVFGQVFASTGSYAPAFIGQIAALGVASAIALALHVITRKASAH